MFSLRKLVTACLICVLTAGMARAAGEEDHAADHAALRELRAKVATAIGNQDVATLSTCFAKTFTFTSVDQTPATSPQQVQALFDRFFKAGGGFIVRMKSEPQADGLTRFLNDQTGIASGSSRDTYVLRTGKTIDLDVRWTAVVMKEDGAWKVVAAHVGLDPLNNPILNAATSFWKKACLAGIVAGLAAGVFLGWVFNRRRTA